MPLEIISIDLILTSKDFLADTMNLQKLIVTTNVKPFCWLYRLYYQLALKKITQTFKDHPDIVGVYLIAGMASGDWTPGLSDIDLIIIVNNNQGSKQRVGKSYEHLSRSIPVIKIDEQNIYTVDEIKLWYQQSNFYLKYKIFTECKEQGKLLCGIDILDEYEELTGLQKNEPAIGQLEFVWYTFLKGLLLAPRLSPLQLNYRCYKVTCDMCKVLLSAHGQRIFQRKKALDLAFPLLQAEGQSHLLMIKKLASDNFAGHYNDVLKETYEFCGRMIQKIIKTLPALDETTEDRDALKPGHYDLDTLDLIITQENQRVLNNFLALVEEKYKDTIDSVLLSPFNLLHMQEHRLGIFLTLKKPLSLEQTRELGTALKPPTKIPQQLSLYVTTNDVAYCLNYYEVWHMHGILVPLRWLSFTLLYLSTSHAVLRGKPLNYSSSKKLVLDYFWQDPNGFMTQSEGAIRQVIFSPDVLRISPIEFQHFFWQTIRLKSLQSTFDSGKIFIALSSAQVCRMFHEQAIGPWLNEFRQEYQKELGGAISNAESYFPQALDLLKQKYAQ